MSLVFVFVMVTLLGSHPGPVQNRPAADNHLSVTQSACEKVVVVWGWEGG